MKDFTVIHNKLDANITQRRKLNEEITKQYNSLFDAMTVFDPVSDGAVPSLRSFILSLNSIVDKAETLQNLKMERDILFEKLHEK